MPSPIVKGIDGVLRGCSARNLTWHLKAYIFHFSSTCCTTPKNHLSPYNDNSSPNAVCLSRCYLPTKTILDFLLPVSKLLPIGILHAITDN